MGNANITHMCRQAEDGSKRTSTAGKEYGLRDSIDRVAINWAGEAVALGVVSEKDLSAHSLVRVATAKCLQESAVVLKNLGWQDIVPPAHDGIDLPDVVVSRGSSWQWVLANAIGIALGRSPGHPDLERGFELHTPTKPTMRQYLGRLDLNASAWAVHRCVQPDCSYVQPFYTTCHECIDDIGDHIQSTKGKGGRQSRRSVIGDTITGWQELPADVKVIGWASWLTKENELDVDGRLLGWRGSASPPGASSKNGVPAKPLSSPHFGGTPLSLAPRQETSARKQYRAQRVQALGAGSGSSSSSGGVTPAQPAAGPSRPSKRRKL